MKHTSFFPFLVLALTLILVTGFVFSASPKLAGQKDVVIQTPPVSDKQYQEALKIVLKKFVTAFDATQDLSVRAQLTDQTLSTLLTMRVPVQEKDLHLTLAIFLQKMKQGFVANPQDVMEGYMQIKQIISQTNWLSL
jgi:hypothetical protein